MYFWERRIQRPTASLICRTALVGFDINPAQAAGKYKIDLGMNCSGDDWQTALQNIMVETTANPEYSVLLSRVFPSKAFPAPVRRFRRRPSCLRATLNRDAEPE